jgi:hypothetical protein
MDPRLERLRDGQHHGRTVADALLTGSRELESSKTEKSLHGIDRQGRARRPRPDVFSVMEGVDEEGNRIVVIDEIKRSDWDRMAPQRVRPNALRYARQLWRYIDADEAAAFPVVMAAIHFPARPTAIRAAEVEAIFEEAGVSVIWA